MFPTRRVGGFVFRLFLFYGVLLVPWPGLERGYAGVFRTLGNGLFASFGPHGSVRFRSPSEQNTEWDTELHLINRRSGSVWRMGHNSRYTGYLSTAAVVALVLATPVPWSRRWRGLVAGLVLVNAFVALRVAISILYGFRSIDLFVFGPFWNRAVDVVYMAVSVSTVAIFLVPALIWILVIFRQSDWEPLPGKTDSKPRRHTS